MSDERLKQLIEQAGMQNSASLYGALQQAENEGFQAGAASRDAEVAKLINAVADHVTARIELRTHINVLLKALQLTQDQVIRGRTFPATANPSAWFNAVTIALASTPEQSLTDYRNKVLDECINVAWNHEPDCNGPIEMAIRAMKERP